MPPLPEIPIEDFYEDILGKAARGLGFSAADLAAESGVPEATVTAMLKGQFDAEATGKIAPILGLDATRLATAAAKKWYPQPVEIEGLAQFNTPWGDMLVNAFLVWDPDTKLAAVFDTGTDSSPITALAKQLGLTITHIFITHTHTDHIADLEQLFVDAGNPPIYSSSLEPAPGARTFDEGTNFGVGHLRVESLTTSGHSVGGTTYVVHGLAHPVAVVGDSIFAGSMGGGKISYTDALENNRKKILTLPPETVICPGHGPATTVAEENANNPFFPVLTSNQ